MMKKVSALVLACAIMLSLAACGGSGYDENQPDEQAQETTLGETTLGRNSPSDDGIKTLVSSTDVELSPYLVRAQGITDNLYGYIDIRTGEYVIEPRFTSCDEAFGDDGWAIVSEDVANEQGNNTSIINTSGELLFAYDALGERYSHSGVREYEGDCIVVHTSCNDGPNDAFLYHGSEFICKLKLPMEDYEYVEAWLPTLSNSQVSGWSYEPGRYIVLNVATNDGKYLYSWYDANGNLIYTHELANGCLVGDETGYYFIGDGVVEVIDFDGNVINTLERNDGCSGNVDWDEDNWYAVMNLTGTSGLYTNGLTQLCEIPGITESRDNIYLLDVTDSIVRGPDRRWYKLDGTLLDPELTLCTPFQNGYGKACTLFSLISASTYHYIDVEGNRVLEIPEGKSSEYSSVLKDGYLIYEENELYGIMKIDGTVVTNACFLQVYDSED